MPLRVNVFDVAVLALGLLPGATRRSWLLVTFRPAQVHITTSVTVLPAGKEEQRIANPPRAAVKLKVKGDGFMPMLRARIGTVEPSPRIHVQENPGSADVIVPPMAPGEYDVPLTDGGTRGRTRCEGARRRNAAERGSDQDRRVVVQSRSRHGEQHCGLARFFLGRRRAHARGRPWSYRDGANLIAGSAWRGTPLKEPGKRMFERKAALVVARDSGVPA